jgi:hypothetical protein
MAVSLPVVISLSLDWILKRFTFLTDDDSDDHAVDTQNTCHDDRDERLHDDCGSPDRNTADACACLGSSVGGSEIWIRKNILASTRARLTPMNPKKEDPALMSTST